MSGIPTESDEAVSSIAIATNAPFSRGHTFTDARLAAAVVDRLTFNAHLITTQGDATGKPKPPPARGDRRLCWSGPLYGRQ